MVLTLATSFGDLLRHLRKKKALSQLELALMAEVSQRHVSFLESGRSAPTQEMILRLASVLELPLRTQNQLLSAAGFSPLHSETDLEAPEMQAVRQALDFMLRQQEPYPALCLDHHWNLLKANQSAHRLLARLLDLSSLPTEVFPEGVLNMICLTLHPQGLFPLIENPEPVVVHLLQRLQREALLAGAGSAAEAFYRRLATWHPGIHAASNLQPQVPVLSSVFVKEGLRLNLFSTITTLGTPCDITLQELRIESLFPADAATDAQLRQFAAEAASD